MWIVSPPGSGWSIAAPENRAPDPVAGMRRVDEERPDLGRVRLRVEPGLVPLGARVAAEQCPPPAPAAARDDVPCERLGDEVGPIVYERRIDAESSLECRFDLRRSVVRGPESVYRPRDQLMQYRNVIEPRQSQFIFHAYGCGGIQSAC